MLGVRPFPSLKEQPSVDYFCCCNGQRRLFLWKRNFPFWLLEGVTSKWNRQARSAWCHRTPGQLRVCAGKPTDNPSTHLSRSCKMQLELTGFCVSNHPFSAAPCEAKALSGHCRLYRFFSSQRWDSWPRARPMCQRLPPAPLPGSTSAPSPVAAWAAPSLPQPICRKTWQLLLCFGGTTISWKTSAPVGWSSPLFSILRSQQKQRGEKRMLSLVHHLLVCLLVCWA